MSRYLTINSVDRASYESPSEFKIKIKNGLNQHKAKLIFAQIPNTYYNVTNNNNKIIINGVTRSLTPGNYNLDEFFDVFSNNLDVLITGITFNDVLGVVTFTLSSSLNIQFPLSGSMHSILGFSNSYNQTASSHSSLYPPSLSKHLLYIDINEFSGGHTSSNISLGSTSFTIPNNVNKNEIIMYNEKTNFNQEINCKSSTDYIYELYIQVKDFNNNPTIGLGEWSCVIQFI